MTKCKTCVSTIHKMCLLALIVDSLGHAVLPFSSFTKRVILDTHKKKYKTSTSLLGLLYVLRFSEIAQRRMFNLALNAFNRSPMLRT